MRHSEVIQFYSAIHNIGNYTPVLGIQDLLGFAPDVWSMHVKPIDFDYINRNYKAVIIGGAGLLYKVFDPFWRQFEKECTLPTIMWGLGGCFPIGDPTPNVDRDTVRSVASRSPLINLRDTLTAEYYGFQTVSITPCPTIAWLQRFRDRVDPDSERVLFASHTEVVPEDDIGTIREAIALSGRDWIYSDNVQSRRFGVKDFITRLYCNSRVVVATRLHGAIIAYGLGIPYLSMVWDEKLSAFQREWGNGTVAESFDELTKILEAPWPSSPVVPQQPLQHVCEFGSLARQFLAECGISEAAPSASVAKRLPFTMTAGARL